MRPLWKFPLWPLWAKSRPGVSRVKQRPTAGLQPTLGYTVLKQTNKLMLNPLNLPHPRYFTQNINCVFAVIQPTRFGFTRGLKVVRLRVLARVSLACPW